MAKPKSGWHNGFRDEAGIIVTLREQRKKTLYTTHVPGKRADALRHLAKTIDESELDWRLLCYSTPETIRGDMQGRRTSLQGSRNQTGHTDCVEAMVLGRIGRLDLLDPTLDHGHASKAKS